MTSNKGEARLSPPFWDHQRHCLVELRRAIERTLTHLPPLSGSKVLDFGCGDRPYERLFRDGGATYTGADLGSEAEVSIHPGQPLPLPDGAFDLVGSFQVLEHVWDLDWYLGEARRLLKPGGHLLLSTHGAWLYHPHPTDFRRWTRDGLLQELETRGFHVEHHEAAVGPLALTTQYRLLGYRQALLGIPFLGSVAIPCLATVMNARMMVEDAITPAKIRDDNASVYVVLARPAPHGAPSSA